MRAPISEKDLPIFTMEHCVNAIAIEASILDNLAATLKNFLPSFIQNLLPGVKKFDSVVDAPIVELNKDQRKAVEKLKHIEFHYLRQLKFDATEGFVGNFLEYATVLAKQVDYIRNTSQQIKDYRIFLSGVLADGDSRLSTKDLSGKNLAQAKIRKEKEAELASFIRRGSYTTSVLIGDIFNRTSEIEEAIKQIAATQTVRNGINLKQIKEDVHACVDLLNTIMERMKDSTILNLTPAVAKSLSTGAYEMAEAVEYISIVYYTSLAATSATNRLIDKVNIF
jgi:hypothetical protein